MSLYRNGARQFSSVAQSCPTLCSPMNCSAPGFSVHHQLLEFIQTHVHGVGSAIQPSHPLLCPSPPAFPASGSFQKSQFFTSDGQSIGVSVSASVLPMNIQDIDWFDLLIIQGTLKHHLQHLSSIALFLWCSAFFMVQLSHPYITTSKTIALTTRAFVGKVMSLLFNMVSRLVLAFLPKSKHLLISWLQSRSSVILEPKKIKSLTVSLVSPFICYEVITCHELLFLYVEF